MTTVPAPQQYEADFAAAVRLFWNTRDEQARRQIEKGVRDRGTRGAVAGGGHLLPMGRLVEKVFIEAGIPSEAGNRTLPGYYRGSKTWDGVVTYKDELVAILEVKSQVGSFGKNQNNRIEEMIGQGRDINLAARYELLGSLPPWFGYVLLLEDHPESTQPRSGARTREGFPVDAVYTSSPSYIERYAIALHRMRMESEMRAVCFAATDRTKQSYWFPDGTMTFTAFAGAVQARVHEVRAALD